jgi:hypothetical protein
LFLGPVALVALTALLLVLSAAFGGGLLGAGGLGAVLDSVLAGVLSAAVGALEVAENRLLGHFCFLRGDVTPF